jgi:asparagine synthase (glutamine-hydrolysing)
VDRGHRLKTKSDSEILLHLYEEEGVHCLRHLRGEFAFILSDERNGLLFAARDRFGIKPLYYARVGDTLYLASEVKALFAAGVPPRWDHEAMFQELHGILDQDRSLFGGIFQIPPGHYMLASRYHTQILRYWDLNFPSSDAAQTPPRSEGEYIEVLRDRLREAIRLRLRADVPVGCYLSGGIDSCAILGIASDLRTDPIEAFTIAFDTGPYDEGPIAAEMAGHAGARFHNFPMPHALLAEHWADAIAHCEMLQANANLVGKYLLSRSVRDHGLKVVLTGEGADEVLGGYPPFVRDMLRHDTTGDVETIRRKLAAHRDANKHFGLFGAGTTLEGLPVDNVKSTLGFVPELFEQWAQRGLRMQSIVSAGFKHEFAGRDPYRVLLNKLDVNGQMRGRSALHQAMYLWAKTFFPNKLLNFLADRMEMAHSIEGRTPFLDHHLVEATVTIPPTLKVRDGTDKYVLREAARPHITDTVYRRPKHSFMAPLDLKACGLDELVQDSLRGSSFAGMPFFDQAAVVRLLDDVSASSDQNYRDRLGSFLLLVTSASILHQRYRL